MNDKSQLSIESLQDIAKMVRRYLQNNINPNSIYANTNFTSFGEYSHLLEDNISISFYHNNNSFHGNVNNGGHFSGSVVNNIIYINCSQTSNSTSISF